MTAAPGRSEGTWHPTAAAAAPFALIVTVLLAFGLLLSWHRVSAVWQTGAFFDSDDAMRIVQVRALLAGQPWFDMTAYRLDPPSGVFMHWSRIVDVPLAILISVFRMAVAPDMAERLARLVFPLAMQGALYAGMARLARRLMGDRAVLPALVLTLMSGIMLAQFQPGRVDHHAPQIVLLAFMLAALVDALEPVQARQAAVAAVLACVSLAISLENLPFVAILTGALVLSWVWHGDRLHGTLSAYAAGLAVAAPACFMATVSPTRWLVAAPDAFSATHLVGGLAGAAALGLLSAASARLAHPTHRLTAAALACGGVLAIVALTFPSGLREPFADLDPLLRMVWLDNVKEAWSLPRFWHEQAGSAITFAVPIALGALAAAAATWREQGLTRLRWAFVTAVIVTGLAMAFWRIRVFTSVSPLAVLGGVWLVLRLYARIARSAPRLAALSLLALLPFSSIAWALVVDAPADRAAANCHAASAFAPLALLPPGKVLAPIDAGSHLLALTPHSVFAAPYHRNNHGNRLALDAFAADPETARRMLETAGTTYVMICTGLGETHAASERAPKGLAAALLANDIPAWLHERALVGTPYRVFALTPAAR